MEQDPPQQRLGPCRAIRASQRSETFPGLADAMADQWSGILSGLQLDLFQEAA
jgi:hypothetical protein